MKAFKIIIAVLLFFAIVIFAIDRYLGPDDLARCDTSPSSRSGCGEADAIVAISGGDTAARADEAIRLYKNGWGNYLIFSGAAADKSGPSNAQVMQERAIDAGVDPNVIIVEENSENTIENAEQTTNIFKTHDIKSAILVTSGYHERRALIEFHRRALGVEVRAHPVAEDKQWSRTWWLTPAGWGLAIPELIRSLILSTGGVDRT